MSEKQQYGPWIIEGSLTNIVFVARHKENKQQAVVKTGRRNAVEREVKNLKILEHPNIIRLLDYDLESDTPYLVTEYHSAGRLRSGTLGKIPFDVRLEICQSIYKAVKYIHSQGILRGCGRLANIVVSDNNEAILIDLDSQKIFREKQAYEDMKGMCETLWEIAGPEYFIKQIAGELESK